MQVALALYRAGIAPLLLLSGGGGHTVPEAEVMRGLAIAAGVPESALLLEPLSRNTQENATHSAALLAGCSWTGDVILVTDRYHALRARLLFRLAGLAVRSVHAAPMSPRQRLAMLISESFKLPLSVTHALWHRAARAMRW